MHLYIYIDIHINTVNDVCLYQYIISLSLSLSELLNICALGMIPRDSRIHMSSDKEKPLEVMIKHIQIYIYTCVYIYIYKYIIYIYLVGGFNPSEKY